MNEAARYLQLSSVYSRFLNGLRWSATEGALEHEDGSTFAFNQEVALFLEGFASGGRLIHFGFLLHLLQLLKNREKTFAPGSLRLSYAFADTGRPLRNAGVFCAALCRDVPRTAGAVDLIEVLDWLRNPARPLRWYLVSEPHDPAEEPPLEPAAFEEQFLQRLEDYTTEEIRHWFKHGCRPGRGEGEELARELPLPRTLTGALAALLERPRLAGALPYVAQLVSALALPLRHPAPPELPVGGYADVTTHGSPDQLLLSQFALDDLDFLRRHADHELLYFRREEPHARSRHELIVVLDQGVRTWGDVRLVLSAAVLALGKRAARGQLPFLVAATSRAGEVLDPLTTDDSTLGQLIEASDLSANPGLALEGVLERPATGSRDIVLLTHPRNLLEKDVRAAALRAGPDTRLLALTLDGRGRASLNEVRHGVPVPLREFRVDFAPSPPPPPPTLEPAPGRFRPWRGDVEPVPFPFRFGTAGPVGATFFDFDRAGEWLLTASRDGLLHVWKVDGSSQSEMLPRGIFKGKPLTRLDAVLGVAGGFVVGGQVQGRLVAVHYDLRTRTCTSHNLGVPLSGPRDWRYSARHHVLLVRGVPQQWGYAIDLATGDHFACPRGGPASRAREAWFAPDGGALPASAREPCDHSAGRSGIHFREFSALLPP